MVTTTDIGGSGQNIQIKEDFSDIIYNLTPTETPVLSLCKRSSTENTEVGWFLDKLTDAKNFAVTGGDQVPYAEGAPAGDDDFEKIRRAMNMTQIFQKTVSTSGTAEAVDFYGRASEMAYQMTKKAQELKRDIETTICSVARQQSGGQHSCIIEDTDNVDGGAAANTDDGVRQFANFKQQVIDNPFGASRTIYDFDGVLTESKMNDMMEQLWLNGGEPSLLICNGNVANALADFATSNGTSGLAGRYRESGQGTKLVNVVDLYVTPFGELKVVLDRFLNGNEVAAKQDDFLLIDPEYIECCYLREPKVEDIAKTGDSDKKMLVSELTFKVLAPDGVGIGEQVFTDIP